MWKLWNSRKWTGEKWSKWINRRVMSGEWSVHALRPSKVQWNCNFPIHRTIEVVKFALNSNQIDWFVEIPSAEAIFSPAAKFCAIYANCEILWERHLHKIWLTVRKSLHGTESQQTNRNTPILWELWANFTILIKRCIGRLQFCCTFLETNEQIPLVFQLWKSPACPQVAAAQQFHNFNFSLRPRIKKSQRSSVRQYIHVCTLL